MANYRVIDVSQHQGKIDWSEVKKHIDGAIIRCGYGSNIPSQDDTRWADNVAACEMLKIPYGVYIYSYAKTAEQIKSELAHVRRLVKGHKPQLPIYFDAEENGTQSIAPEAIKTILEGLKDMGFVGVYANTNWWNNYLTKVTQYPRWVAQYAQSCTYKGDYEAWQYTSSAFVEGINGRVDMSIFYGSKGADKYFATKPAEKSKQVKIAKNANCRYSKNNAGHSKNGHGFIKTSIGEHGLLRAGAEITVYPDVMQTMTFANGKSYKYIKCSWTCRFKDRHYFYARYDKVFGKPYGK